MGILMHATEIERTSALTVALVDAPKTVEKPAVEGVVT